MDQMEWSSRSEDAFWLPMPDAQSVSLQSFFHIQRFTASGLDIGEAAGSQLLNGSISTFK